MSKVFYNHLYMNKISRFSLAISSVFEMTSSYLRFYDFSVFLTYFRDKIELGIEKISFVGEIRTWFARVPWPELSWNHLLGFKLVFITGTSFSFGQIAILPQESFCFHPIQFYTPRKSF